MSSTPDTQDIDRTPVAKDIWCFSPKEKAMTWHVVINHDAKGYVDRVQCKVTKQIHKYKRQNKPEPVRSASAVVRRAAGTASKTAAATKKSIESSAMLEETWFKGVKAWGERAVTNYDPKKYYAKNQVIEHSTFGKGVVQGRRDTKVDVLFKEGMKILPTARTPNA